MIDKNKRINISNSSEDKKKNDKKFIYTVMGFILLFLILTVVTIASFFSGAPKTKSKPHKDNTVKIKKLPNSSNNTDNQTIPSDQAASNIKSAIKIALSVIEKSKATSGQGITFSDLSQSDLDQVNQYFNTNQAIQDFNDIINISSNSNTNEYGDAGTGISKEKVPKAGTKYVISTLSIQYENEDTDNYLFTVKLKYHPKGFKNSTKTFNFYIDNSSGKVSKISEKI